MLVEAAVVPPANTAVVSTRDSVRITLSLLVWLVIAGCIIVVATTLGYIRLSPRQQHQRLPMPSGTSPSCCCNQSGRSITGCNAACSCIGECTQFCAQSGWDPQCRMPYTTLHDPFRDVAYLSNSTPQHHADGPLISSEYFKKLCPNHKSVRDFPTSNVFPTTGVGGAQWFRFIGSAGDALPLRPPPEYRCGTANGGWLSGYNRTVAKSSQEDATKGNWWQQKLGNTATVAPSLESCARNSALHSHCSRCPRVAPGDRTVAMSAGLCQERCLLRPNASRLSGVPNALGWCSESDIHVYGDVVDGYTQSIDCRPCQHSVMWTLQGSWDVETSNVPPRMYTLTINGTSGAYGKPGRDPSGIITSVHIDETDASFQLDWYSTVLGDSGVIHGSFSPDATGRDYTVATQTIERSQGISGKPTSRTGRTFTWKFTRQNKSESDPLISGPPIDYAEPGRYPTAAEGKVERTVCFSAGTTCSDKSNDACGGATCLMYQSMQVVRCDGFFLWQLHYVPFCRSGFCTINSTATHRSRHQGTLPVREGLL